MIINHFRTLRTKTSRKSTNFQLKNTTPLFIFLLCYSFLRFKEGTVGVTASDTDSTDANSLSAIFLPKQITQNTLSLT